MTHTILGYRVNRNVPLIIDLKGGGGIAPTPTQKPGESGSVSANQTETSRTQSTAQFKKSIEMQWPVDYIQGSRHASIDVIGDIMVFINLFMN